MFVFVWTGGIFHGRLSAPLCEGDSGRGPFHCRPRRFPLAATYAQSVLSSSFRGQKKLAGLHRTPPHFFTLTALTSEFLPHHGGYFVILSSNLPSRPWASPPVVFFNNPARFSCGLRSAHIQGPPSDISCWSRRVYLFFAPVTSQIRLAILQPLGLFESSFSH